MTELERDADPFVEVREPTQKPQPSSGTIDTSAIDAYRQGVYIKTSAHRYSGPVKFSEGSEDHIPYKSHFGQQKLFDDSDIFAEKNNINESPDAFIKNANGFSYPILVGDVNTRIKNQYDGVIEAFPIREVISQLSIDYPDVARKPRADLLDGNKHPFFGHDRVFPEVQFGEERIENPFFDATETLAGRPIEGLLSDVERANRPYDDVEPAFPTPELPSDLSSFEKGESIIIAQISSSNPFDERLAQRGSFSATAGFVYDRPQAYVITGSSDARWALPASEVYGTDSIAFGGLLQ